MSTRHASQVTRSAANAAWALALCGWAFAAGVAGAAEPPVVSPLSGPFDPWADPRPVGQSRWSLGLVTDPRSVPPWSFGQDARYASPTNLMVGMNLSSSGTARLVWYTPLTQPRLNTLAADGFYNGQSLDPNGVPLPTPLRVGLVLTPTDPWADLRQGSLTKLELNAHLALSLRSRSGGVWLSLGGRW